MSTPPPAALPQNRSRHEKCGAPRGNVIIRDGTPICERTASPFPCSIPTTTSLRDVVTRGTSSQTIRNASFLSVTENMPKRSIHRAVGMRRAFASFGMSRAGDKSRMSATGQNRPLTPARRARSSSASCAPGPANRARQARARAHRAGAGRAASRRG